MLQRAKFFTVRFILVFVLLFAITIPFPLQYFHAPGEFFQPFFLHLNQWSATHLFGLDPKSNLLLESDATGLYLHIFHLFIISILAGVIWTFVQRKSNELRLKYLIHTFSAYILAFFLLQFGFDKVFKHQFPLPEPNTLFTPMGYLSKDILFWSTVGSSYLYSVFAGVIEVIPALLLFSKRTRLLGALIALGVMSHVWIINFSFDISVKILSSYLIVLSSLVIFPYLKGLLNVFFRLKTDFPRPEIEKINAKKNKWLRLLKALIIVVMLFETLLLFVSRNDFNDDRVPRPKYHGAYTVLEKKRNGDVDSMNSTYFGDLSAVKRVFIHRRGYLVFQFKDDSMKDFKTSLIQTGNQFSVQTKTKSFRISVYPYQKQAGWIFSWYENDVKYEIAAEQENLAKLPLIEKQFHWTVD